MASKQIEKIKGFRLHLLRQIESLTLSQLNHIPEGHSNNIIWNLGHLVSVQQTLCYTRAGQTPTVDEQLITPFVFGTRPGHPVDNATVTNIKQVLITSLYRLQSDIDKKLFTQYTPVERIREVYGFSVNNIEDVLDYLLYHDGYHAGYILSIKKLVQGSGNNGI